MLGSNIDYVSVLKKTYSDKKAVSTGILLFVITTALGYLGQNVHIAISSILGIIGLIVYIIIAGYSIKLLNNESKGDDSLPEWENIPELLILGIKSLLVTVAYMLPVLLVITTLTLIVFFGLISSLLVDPYAVASFGYFGVWMSICIVLVAFVFYFLMGALANFSKDYSIMSGFEFKEIKSRVLTIKYFVAFMSIILLSIGLGLVAVVFSFFFGGLMILPILVYAIISWAILVVTYSILGKAYN